MRVFTGSRTFDVTVGSTFNPFLRVTLAAGVLALAGAADRGVGTLEGRVLVTHAAAAVVPFNAEGTRKMVAAGAIALHDLVYPAAGGKISATPSGKPLGRAMEAASGDNSQIEVLTDGHIDGAGYEAHTAIDTLTVEESGSYHTNLGAGGAVTLTLPQVAGAGIEFHFVVLVAQELRIAPGAAGGIYADVAGYGKQTDDKYITANAAGEHITLVSDGNGDWVGKEQNGTWTLEA